MPLWRYTSIEDEIVAQFGGWSNGHMRFSERTNVVVQRARAIDSTQVRTADRGIGVHRFVRLFDIDCEISLRSVHPSVSRERMKGTYRGVAGHENTIH